MSSQIDIATTILSALLTGGFILFFLENQHIERDVIERFRSIMDPYYHKLNRYLQLVYFLRGRIQYTDNSMGWIPEIKTITDEFAYLGSLSYTDGYPMKYLKASQLDNLNHKINQLWYFYDKGSGTTNHISFDPDRAHIFSDEVVWDTLSSISDKFKLLKIDKHLLPAISGSFYTEIWYPVRSVTSELEKWEKSCKISKGILFGNIGLVMSVLIFTMFTLNCINHYWISVLTLVCCLGFGFTLYRLNKIMIKSHKIFS